MYATTGGSGGITPNPSRKTGRRDRWKPPKDWNPKEGQRFTWTFGVFEEEKPKTEGKGSARVFCPEEKKEEAKKNEKREESETIELFPRGLAQAEDNAEWQGESDESERKGI